MNSAALRTDEDLGSTAKRNSICGDVIQPVALGCFAFAEPISVGLVEVQS